MEANVFLFDLIYCCVVLFPVIWSINYLCQAAHTNDKEAMNLMKLTLFRQYYIVVVCYIYFTHIVVYAPITIIAYRYCWTSVMAGESVTLAFYVFTGYRFRPIGHNPYFVVDDYEEEVVSQTLKLEDDFEL